MMAMRELVNALSIVRQSIQKLNPVGKKMSNAYKSIAAKIKHGIKSKKGIKSITHSVILANRRKNNIFESLCSTQMQNRAKHARVMFTAKKIQVMLINICQLNYASIQSLFNKFENSFQSF